MCVMWSARRIDRRELLLRGGLLAGGSALAGGLAAGGATARDGTADADAPLFELDPGYVDLTTFLLAPHPRGVREAIERHRRALDANPALYLRESEAALEEDARAAAAAYSGQRPATSR